MAKEIKEIISDLEKKAKPFTDKLKEKGMDAQADQILSLIGAIEEDGLNSCASLYLLLQSEMFNEIEEEGQEAAESLMYLYELMAKVYGGAVLEMIAK